MSILHDSLCVVISLLHSRGLWNTKARQQTLKPQAVGGIATLLWEINCQSANGMRRVFADVRYPSLVFPMLPEARRAVAGLSTGASRPDAHGASR